jgi:hypothetical protein
LFDTFGRLRDFDDPLEASLMKLRLLGTLPFTAKKHDRRLIPTQVAISAVFVVIVPPGIGFGNAYRSGADGTAALGIGTA